MSDKDQIGIHDESGRVRRFVRIWKENGVVQAKDGFCRVDVQEKSYMV